MGEARDWVGWDAHLFELHPTIVTKVKRKNMSPVK